MTTKPTHWWRKNFGSVSRVHTTKRTKLTVCWKKIRIAQAAYTYQREQNSPPVGSKFGSVKQRPHIKDDKTDPLLEEKIGSASRCHTSNRTKLTSC
jgi:hypothetical protein